MNVQSKGRGAALARGSSGVSDSDSFINEVTEEVRREQLFGYVRRYGWIAALAVILLVGGAAWNEWRKASAAAEAQAVGDSILDALNQEDAEARMTDVAAIEVEGSARAVTALITAAAQHEAGDKDAAAQTLQGLSVNGDVPAIYADLAAFKAAMMLEDPTQKGAAFEALAQPGAPFRLLAIEQQALLALENGAQDEAVGHLNAIIEDAGVTRGLADRANALLTALGANADAATVQQ